MHFSIQTPEFDDKDLYFNSCADKSRMIGHSEVIDISFVYGLQVPKFALLTAFEEVPPSDVDCPLVARPGPGAYWKLRVAPWVACPSTIMTTSCSPVPTPVGTCTFT